ncbi:MAG: hypothetical protein U0930_11695 [Pirellulales bacterium]
MYRSLFNLPQLAGLANVEDCFDSRAWSVEQSVGQWKRLHYCLRELCQMMTARINSEPIYEMKLIYSHHCYLIAEQVTSIRKRVSEMREPPLGLDKVPHPGLERLILDCGRCNERMAFLVSAYEVILPAVSLACHQITLQAHPIADAPSIRTARLIEFELTEVVQVGQSAIAALRSAQLENPNANDLERGSIDLDQWRSHLQACLQASGGIDGCSVIDETASKVAAIPEPFTFPVAFQYSSTPKRDSRFRDSYNAGVNAEAFLYDERFSAQDKTLMMYYKRLREIDVPEAMASILCELDHRPWDFYREMYRQLWDEARHAMMGEIGFASQGIDWTQIPINFTWSLNLNSQLTPQERHGVLFFIEQGLMTRTGKRYEWEIARSIVTIGCQHCFRISIGPMKCFTLKLVTLVREAV